MRLPGVIASSKTGHTGLTFTALIVGAGSNTGASTGGGGVFILSGTLTLGAKYPIVVGVVGSGSTFSTSSVTAGSGAYSGAPESNPPGSSIYGYNGGGGAGGAGGAGARNANPSPPPTYLYYGGNGGPGLSSNITGSTLSYGGGGASAGTGGGGTDASSVYGGGAGVSRSSQNGVVIISLPNSYAGTPTVSGILAPAKTTNGSNYVFTFSGTGTGTVTF